MRLSNAIRNTNSIISTIKTDIDPRLFIDRSVGSTAFINAFGASQFFTLEDKNFSTQLKDLILSNFDDDVKNTYDFMQVQKYNPGNYILPHKDNYINRIRLFQLTDSDVDGIVVQEGNTYKHYNDIAGSEIVFDRSAWHWVNPVKTTRYSLVIGFD